MPHIAIGLPCYNRPDTLDRAIKAIRAQTHQDWTLLISDNCSPNIMVQHVARKHAAEDSRIHYIRQPRNIGLNHNFAYVFNYHPRTDAPLWMFAADDDIMAPTYIETCLRYMTPEAVISFTRIRKVDAAGQTADANFSDNVNGASAVKFILNSGGNHVPYGLMRRAHVSPWFFHNRFGVDHLAVLDMLRHGRIHIHQQALYTSTIHGTGWNRAGFHQFYDTRGMKIAVTLSSTLTWLYEFVRFIIITPYSWPRRVILLGAVAARFSRPKYWRRFAGDMLALVTRRDIWRF